VAQDGKYDPWGDPQFENAVRETAYFLWEQAGPGGMSRNTGIPPSNERCESETPTGACGSALPTNHPWSVPSGRSTTIKMTLDVPCSKAGIELHITA
jgi:hypothetical protein